MMFTNSFGLLICFHWKNSTNKCKLFAGKEKCDDFPATQLKPTKAQREQERNYDLTQGKIHTFPKFQMYVVVLLCHCAGLLDANVERWLKKHREQLHTFRCCNTQNGNNTEMLPLLPMLLLTPKHLPVSIIKWTKKKNTHTHYIDNRATEIATEKYQNK